MKGLGVSVSTTCARSRHALAQRGCPSKVASDRFGHFKAGITLDLYSYVMPGMQEETATRVDEALRAAVAKSNEVCNHRAQWTNVTIDSERICALTSQLFEHVKSPPVPRSVHRARLAYKVLIAADRANSTWTKLDCPATRSCRGSPSLSDLDSQPPSTETDHCLEVTGGSRAALWPMSPKRCGSACAFRDSKHGVLPSRRTNLTTNGRPSSLGHRLKRSFELARLLPHCSELPRRGTRVSSEYRVPSRCGEPD